MSIAKSFTKKQTCDRVVSLSCRQHVGRQKIASSFIRQHLNKKIFFSTNDRWGWSAILLCSLQMSKQLEETGIYISKVCYSNIVLHIYSIFPHWAHTRLHRRHPLQYRWENIWPPLPHSLQKLLQEKVTEQQPPTKTSVTRLNHWCLN